jgi:hypothetical protein
LNNYLRDQALGLSDLESSAYVRTISPSYQTKGEVATKVLLKLETDLNNSSIVRLDLCFGRMKECNVALFCNTLN